MTEQSMARQPFVIENLDILQDVSVETTPAVQGGMMAHPDLADFDGVFKKIGRPLPFTPKPRWPIGGFPRPRPLPMPIPPHPAPPEHPPISPICGNDPHGPLPWCAVIL
jgi:hypothetical protein